jgi:hypothetical protein
MNVSWNGTVIDSPNAAVISGTVVDGYQTVQSISPSRAPRAGGTRVIIKGTGFGSAKSAEFGSTGAKLRSTVPAASTVSGRTTGNAR